MPTPMVLRVLRASEPSSLSTGTSFVIDGDAVVGRSPEADIVLGDPSVSRRHLRIEFGPPLRLHPLTDRNGTFVEGAALNGHHEVGDDGVRLQLGGVLLSLAPLAVTDPVWEVLTPGRPSASFVVLHDGGQCLVRCGGEDLPLNGAAARFLALLAERPGEVVHHWDLEQETGTPHLAPLASQVRRVLVEAHERGLVDLFSVASPAALEVEGAIADLTQLVRRMVQSRRGHGYALLVKQDDVVVQRE